MREVRTKMREGTLKQNSCESWTIPNKRQEKKLIKELREPYELDES